MIHAFPSWAALSLPLLLGVLPAQTPLPHRLPVREACGLQNLDGELWGIGPDYKVAFRQDGIEFTPALGTKAPRNHPLALRLATVGRGHDRHPAAAAAPKQHDLQVRYDRGSFVERYDVSARGIAQSFVFDTAPAGRGDLVVRLDLATDLPLVAQDADGLRFELPELGGVTIGGVTGIDAKGHTTPGTITCDGRTVELRLPARFVDSAAFPLVLDPQIGTVFAVTNSTADYEDPELSAPIQEIGSYVCAFTFALSASDHDIRAIRLDGSGGTSGSLFAITTGTGDDENPTIGFVHVRNVFVIAYERGGNIHARSLAFPVTGSPVVSAEATPASGADVQVEPDIGSMTTDDDDDAILVFRNTTQESIQAVQLEISTTGQIVPFGTQTLATTPSLQSIGRPRIAHGGGEAGRFLIVYPETGLLVGSDTNVRMILINRNLGVLASTTLTSTSTDDDNPDVDGNGDRWMVVFESEDVEGSGTNDIRAAGIVYDELSSSLAVRSVTNAALDAEDETDPVVAYFPTGSCMVAWRHRASGSIHTDVSMRTLDQLTGSWCEPSVLLANTGDAETNLTAAAHHLQDGEGLVLWETSGTFSGNGDLDGIAWDAADGVRATPFGAGICNTPPRTIDGCARNGNLSHSVQVHGIAVGTPSVLVVSLSSSWITCGSCRLYANPYDGILFPAVGENGGLATVALSLLQPGMQGLTFHAQWLVHNPNPGATCSWVQADLSNPLSITIE